MDKEKFIKAEFEKLDKKSLWHTYFQQIKNESLNKDLPTEHARFLHNRPFNRYRDVLPYDDTRVCLAYDRCNYINASYVTMEEVNRKYILTQGPLPNTVIHFWLMVWQENTRAIVMLNKLIEKDQIKCTQYWPDKRLMKDGSEVPQLVLNDVNLKVELVSEKEYSSYFIRNFRLNNTQTEEERIITQFHYTTWPDFGVPESPITFLKFLRAVRRSGFLESNVGPAVVHCSAGIGRSGTFCLVDCYLVMIMEYNLKVKLKNILLKMRKCRMGLIQTQEQLRFSYLTIIQGLNFDWDVDDDNVITDTTKRDADGNLIKEVTGRLTTLEKTEMDEDEDDPPPPPPPRKGSFELEKPLPSLPKGDFTDSEDSDESFYDDIEGIDVLSTDEGENEGELSDKSKDSDETGNSSRNDATEDHSKDSSDDEDDDWTADDKTKKRKRMEKKEKYRRLTMKIKEMHRKQEKAEKQKALKRSLLNIFCFTLAFAAISGSVVSVIHFINSYFPKPN